GSICRLVGMVRPWQSGPGNDPQGGLGAAGLLSPARSLVRLGKGRGCMATAGQQIWRQAAIPLGLLWVGVGVSAFGLGWREAIAGPNWVLLLNAFWHFLAAYLFMAFPQGVIARYVSDRPVPGLAAEAMQFLGGMNAAISTFAILALGYG